MHTEGDVTTRRTVNYRVRYNVDAEKRVAGEILYSRRTVILRSRASAGYRRRTHVQYTSIRA